jgi:hypothetical protein
MALGLGDVPCLRTFWTVDDLEFDRLTLLQGPEAIATDRGVVNEDVAASFALNESVPFGVVEPLDLACDAHRSLPCLLCDELSSPPLDRVQPDAADELRGTKKDRECLRGLDFNA